MIKDKPEECEACCCVDMGSIIDNQDCTAQVALHFDTEAMAQQALSDYCEKAREVESDPCKISSEIIPQEQGVLLNASFEFACQAETLIFQLALR